MANRILRDWTCSETIDQLSESSEIFFTRLIMKADDFGRFYGSPKLLKAQLYPLKEYSLKQVEKWRDEVVRLGIVSLYFCDGKEYIEIKDFNQRLRLMKSKFPEPQSNDCQMTVKCQSIDGLKRNETKLETETETNPKPETEVEVEVPKKSKKEIPKLSEFLNYVLTIPEFSPKFDLLKYSIQSKYEAWVENGWRDGHGNEIKQWKTKLKNTLPHLKPINNFNNGTAKQNADEAMEATKRRILGEDYDDGQPESSQQDFEFTSYEDVGSI